MNADTATPPKDQNETGEVIYFKGSPALRGSIGQLFFNGLLSAGLLTAAVIFQAKSMWILPGAILIALVLMAVPVLMARSTHYCISSYRIDFERGILSKNIDTLELWHVDDIKFRQSLMDRILRIGTIVIISHDSTTPWLPLQSLPTPRPLFESLKQRIITVKRQRGVIKLDGG